tara:strand:- start:977 stop:1159 length:183 start_codon:yes stop_codon:yes gene_type:complete
MLTAKNDPGSPTNFDLNLYRLLIKLFQNCKEESPELIQTFGIDLIKFILQKNKTGNEQDT